MKFPRCGFEVRDRGLRIADCVNHEAHRAAVFCSPLYQRGAGGISLRRRVSGARCLLKIPPNPPFQKGGVRIPPNPPFSKGRVKIPADAPFSKGGDEVGFSNGVGGRTQRSESRAA